MKIQTVSELLTPDQCELLIELSRPNLTTSLVQYGTGRLANTNLRRSENYRWRKDNTITAELKRQAAELTGAPLEAVEAVDVVHYEKDGFFGEHHDGTHRSHTLAVALNSEFVGGRTIFPRLGHAHSIPRGCGLLWTNDEKAYHECTKIESGEKWIAVVWVKNV